ncbi:Protein-lysine N-methyltransferase efm6 [Umbelopsis sp. WA50703]
MSTPIILNPSVGAEIIASLATSSLPEVEQLAIRDPFLELSLGMETGNATASKIDRTSTFHYKGLSQPIIINEDTSGGCGGKTWEAADVTCNYLIWKHQQDSHAAFKNKRILELGSGTGLVGLVLGAICNPNGAKEIVITDQLPMLALMENNIITNGLNDIVSAKILDWGTSLPVWMNEKPDVIIASDCVYLEIAFQPLIDTLVMLSNEKTEIYLCYKRRRKADKRFFMLARKKFTLTEVLEDPNRPDYERLGIHLYLLKRKPGN